MTENIKLLFEQLSKDKNLSEKICSMKKDELICAAKQLSITLTDADFAQPEPMSESELSAVSGGEIQNCHCVVGGGGKADPEDNEKPCACVAIGHGWRGKDVPYCECFMAGGGWDED